MTKLIIETDNNWIKKKVKNTIQTETLILRRAIQNIQNKIEGYEGKYGKLDRETLYGKVDDMELLEWEGEIETIEKLNKKMKSLEEIIFEYE